VDQSDQGYNRAEQVIVGVRYWHKADMLNALTNVRFWEQTGHLTNPCLSSSIYEYTA